MNIILSHDTTIILGYSLPNVHLMTSVTMIVTQSALPALKKMKGALNLSWKPR